MVFEMQVTYSADIYTPYMSNVMHDIYTVHAYMHIKVEIYVRISAMVHICYIHAHRYMYFIRNIYVNIYVYIYDACMTYIDKHVSNMYHICFIYVCSAWDGTAPQTMRPLGIRTAKILI